ncbi:MAG: tRNA (adenosine(37)-N6)-dimethylallyltransferase MiaA [Patescibacteria group bacterium]|nr:tRNA (adenosine(37)-N6)-dimethylallyltransferase MiaA [Patescibacteria group bacterium]
MNNKILAVIGPTASGKTSLAIKLAKKFDGELINTDSRQIYKYLDIGTAKGNVKKLPMTKVQLTINNQLTNPNVQKLDVYKLDGARIHLIDIVEPDKVLSLAQYQKLAYAVIEDILKRGKLPILVGGTGLYIDAIVKGYQIPKVRPDKKLRDKLSSKTVKQLSRQLQSLDPDRFNSLNESDRANPHRLIRLIEISKANSRQQTANSRQKVGSKFDVLFLMPYHTREKLYERINKRVDLILEEGLIEEVKSVIQKGYKFDSPAMTAISYPIVKDYIEGKISLKELKEKFSQGDRNYARRQITWFKRYDVKKMKEDKEAIDVVKKFLILNNRGRLIC